jgi:DNA invertase Pin-like site-specific DNA recombinase
MARIGYARVSTVGQGQDAGLAAQVAALRAAGCDVVREEQASGSSMTELARVLAFLSYGDVLVVTRIDRLTRSTADLMTVMTKLDSRGIGLVVLSMGGEPLDTRNPASKLVLTLAGVAAWEELEGGT